MMRLKKKRTIIFFIVSDLEKREWVVRHVAMGGKRPGRRQIGKDANFGKHRREGLTVRERRRLGEDREHRSDQRKQIEKEEREKKGKGRNLYSTIPTSGERKMKDETP